MSARLEQAPAWVLEAVAAAAAEIRKAEATAPGPDSQAWPLLVDAALAAAFQPAQLAPGVRTGKRDDLEAAVLLHSAVSAGDGTWTLKPSVRRQVLATARSLPAFSEALVRTAETFTDSVSREIRRLLQPGAEAELTLPELEARRIAAAYVDGTPGLASFDIARLDEQIELARLLDRFRRMLGGGRQFFGRAADVEQLRRYVGVLGPEGGVAAHALRAGDALRRGAGQRRAFVLSGAGGAGKTTLIAHFMLEHATRGPRPLPFVYLDFDRPTISTRAPAELLGEMCVQVAAQRPVLAARLGEIRRRALSTASDVERTREKLVSESLAGLCREFRQVLDPPSRPLEQPFLVVCDTFELVQSNPGAPQELATFVQYFLGQGVSDYRLHHWPALRLVLSGRRPEPNFLGPTEDWRIDALDRRGSVDLLMALTSGPPPLSRGPATRLVDAVARQVAGPERGVRPLRLHLMSQALAATQGVPDLAVAALISDLERAGSDIGRHLIDGILVRRILGHVEDPRVRAFSDPGLVVRHIDPTVIREILAPVTPPPAAASSSAVGYPLAPGEEEEIFQAFRIQVTLVEDHKSHVRHLQDVRREMLPLIRAKRPQLFSDLHARAHRFFRARGDRESLGEAIYHGLWCDAPVSDLEAIWDGPQRPDPRIDPDEFALKADASAYVRARTLQPLMPQELGNAPLAARRAWLGARLPTYLRSRRPEDTLPWIAAALEGDADLGGRADLAAPTVQILYNSGHWRAACRLAADVLASAPPRSPEVVGALVAASRIAAHAPEMLRVTDWLRNALPALPPASRTEVALNLYAAAPSSSLPLQEFVPQLLSRDVRLNLRTRRLALLLAPSLSRNLLPGYIGDLDSLPRSEPAFKAMTGVLAEVVTLREQVAALRRAEQSFNGDRPSVAYDALDEAFRACRREVVRRARAEPQAPQFRTLLQFADFDWHPILASVVQQAFETAEARVAREAVAAFARKEVQKDILSGRLPGRRAIAAVAEGGRLYALAHSVATTLPEGFHEHFAAVFRAFADWHDRLVRLPQQ